jgi:glycosyltransferase involved in cell wall biosynthesis
VKILVVVGHYLPSNNAGGPVRSVANLIEQLGDEFDFRVLTSDRDIGNKHSHPEIQVNKWQTVGKARVLYLSPQWQSIAALRRLLQSKDYDLIYLSSFFSIFTAKILLLRNLQQIRKTPVVLVPQGEFSTGAMALKRYKKLPYLLLTNAIGFYRDVTWQASTHYEAQDIRRSILSPFQIGRGLSLSIHVAPDLVSSRLPAVGFGLAPREKSPGELRAVFLSRVSRKKNLDFVLKILHTVQSRIRFDIYGPLEDQSYWKECQHLICALPPHVQVRYCGTVLHEQVPEVFSKYHLLFLPTRGENFGHVVIESLSAGCPVLISDQTPWHGLEMSGVGWDIPLSAPERFKVVLEQCAAMDQFEFKRWSDSGRCYAESYIRQQTTTALEAYRQLFKAE